MSNFHQKRKVSEQGLHLFCFPTSACNLLSKYLLMDAPTLSWCSSCHSVLSGPGLLCQLIPFSLVTRWRGFPRLPPAPSPVSSFPKWTISLGDSLKYSFSS